MNVLLSRMVRRMDRLLMRGIAEAQLGPVCVASGDAIGIEQISADEAREIMAEIDAKSSALLAVLAIILAISAFLFSLSHSWLTLVLMFAQVATISLSILYLLRCLIYEPAPHLRQMLNLDTARDAFALQIEAIKQVHYFNRVILQTVLTSVLFFAMCLLIGVEAFLMAEPV